MSQQVEQVKQGRYDADDRGYFGGTWGGRFMPEALVAALDDDTLRRLHDEAGELGLTVLVEVHDEAETERALALDAELIGVNSRNLKTLEVDPGVFGRLAPQIHADVVKVAESGITGVADVERFVGEGAGVVLVGEALVKDGDPEVAVRAMTGVTAP